MLAPILLVLIPAAVAATLIGWERLLRPPPPPPTELQLAMRRLTRGLADVQLAIADALTPAIRSLTRSLQNFHDAWYGPTSPPLSRADQAVVSFATWLSRIATRRRP